MKRKTLIFVALCILGFSSREIQAIPYKTIPIHNMGRSMPHEYNKIELHGELATLVGPNAIEAGASDDAIYIGFNQSFGNVSISIFNSMGGIVYNTVVNTDVQHVVIIPFANVASGSYIVELSNADGYADGDFEHD
jgi:hypothetical protein